MPKMSLESQECEAVVLVKAIPHASKRYGETVCCAAIDIYGNWRRLYPVSFRMLDKNKKFGRWDRITFKWRSPSNDIRIESCRVEHDSICIIGRLSSMKKRQNFLAKSIVTNLAHEREKGKSFALLNIEVIDFYFRKKPEDELEKQRLDYINIHNQKDFFNVNDLVPIEPSPYYFLYKYRTDDGSIHNGTCQDWETETTYFRRLKEMGEKKALESMVKTYGEDYPHAGMFLAMGTNHKRPEQWLINGIIRLDPIKEDTLL